MHALDARIVAVEHDRPVRRQMAELLNIEQCVPMQRRSADGLGNGVSVCDVTPTTATQAAQRGADDEGVRIDVNLDRVLAPLWFDGSVFVGALKMEKIG